MPDCPGFVIWDPVPPGSKFCAKASAKNKDGKPSDDYDVGVHIVLPDGTAIDWSMKHLVPGPACVSPLQAGGYVATAKLVSGSSGPTVTLNGWSEAPGGSKLFDCTWANSRAGTEFHASIVIVVKAVVEAAVKAAGKAAGKAAAKTARKA